MISDEKTEVQRVPQASLLWHRCSSAESEPGPRMQRSQTPPRIILPVPSRPGQWEEMAPFPLGRRNDDLSSWGSNCQRVALHLCEPGDLVAEFPNGAFWPRSYHPCSPPVYLGKAFLSIFADCSF